MTLGLTLVAATLAIAGQGPQLTPGEMEAFLLQAKIADIREAGGGVTGSQRATLTDGVFTHDVHIQSVDISKSVFNAGRHSELNFKDTYRFNIAGYRLARLLGLDVVPMSVERTVNGNAAAVTWWVDDVQMDERERLKRKTIGPHPLRTSNQLQLMHIWDELIQNRDRNQGNILWTHDWTIRLIDHTRAFRLGDKLRKPEDLRRIDRGLLARLEGLAEHSVAPRRGIALSHRSSTVKPLPVGTRFWSSPRGAVDATCVRGWETNIAMIWGLFAPAPVVCACLQARIALRNGAGANRSS